MRLLALFALMAFAPLCFAQTGQLTQLELQQVPSKKLMVVGDDGSIKKAPNQWNLRLQTEVLAGPEKVGDVLRRNGLAEDPKTIGMLKRLNPGQDFNAGEVAAGTKLDIFVPKTPVVSSSAIPGYNSMTFDTPMVAKWAVRDQVVRAAEVKKVAYSFPTTAFEDKPSFVAHRKFTSDIDSAAKAVEGKADSLTAADLAVAQYQIKFASIRAEAANRNASATGKFSAEDISLLSKAAAPTQDIANRLRSGQSPLPVRRVKVSVLKGDSDEGVKGLQVYVLPAGILDNLNGFTEDEVRSYLTRFSFIDETSPSIGNIAVFDTRVWVGPKLKFAEMAKLVHDGGLKKYRPIDDPSLANPTVELVFRSPSDIVRP